MKKTFLRVLKYTGITIMLIITALAYFVFMSGPSLPENTSAIIDSVLNNEVPDFITGDTGFIVNDDYRIWYESVTPEDTVKGSVLLFMGISNDAMGWPQDFIGKLVGAGYRIIRFDYRDTGLSDWKGNTYSLLDLAKDATIILDSLKIDKAHLVGISLGGMVAQEYAIHYPDRSLTLTSVMSSGNIVDPGLPKISKKFVLDLIRNSIKYSVNPTEKNILKRNVAVRLILRGDADYDIDISGLCEQVLFNLRERNGYNPRASSQQQEATFRSGSRYQALMELNIPTLLIHGINDPFIPIEHSKKLSVVIPDAKSLWMENMGHDVPPVLIDSLTQTMTTHFEVRPR